METPFGFCDFQGTVVWWRSWTDIRRWDPAAAWSVPVSRSPVRGPGGAGAARTRDRPDAQAERTRARVGAFRPRMRTAPVGWSRGLAHGRCDELVGVGRYSAIPG